MGGAVLGLGGGVNVDKGIKDVFVEFNNLQNKLSQLVAEHYIKYKPIKWHRKGALQVGIILRYRCSNGSFEIYVRNTETEREYWVSSYFLVD